MLKPCHDAYVSSDASAFGDTSDLVDACMPWCIGAR